MVKELIDKCNINTCPNFAVFMMFVAVRYYQQTMETEDWVVEEDENVEEEEEPNSSVPVNKLKKGF